MPESRSDSSLPVDTSGFLFSGFSSFGGQAPVAPVPLARAPVARERRGRRYVLEIDLDFEPDDDAAYDEPGSDAESDQMAEGDVLASAASPAGAPDSDGADPALEDPTLVLRQGPQLPQERREAQDPTLVLARDSELSDNSDPTLVIRNEPSAADPDRTNVFDQSEARDRSDDPPTRILSREELAASTQRRVPVRHADPDDPTVVRRHTAQPEEVSGAADDLFAGELPETAAVDLSSDDEPVLPPDADFGSRSDLPPAPSASQAFAPFGSDLGADDGPGDVLEGLDDDEELMLDMFADDPPLGPSFEPAPMGRKNEDAAGPRASRRREGASPADHGAGHPLPPPQTDSADWFSGMLPPGADAEDIDGERLEETNRSEAQDLFASLLEDDGSGPQQKPRPGGPDASRRRSNSADSAADLEETDGRFMGRDDSGSIGVDDLFTESGEIPVADLPEETSFGAQRDLPPESRGPSDRSDADLVHDLLPEQPADSNALLFGEPAANDARRPAAFRPELPPEGDLQRGALPDLPEESPDGLPDTDLHRDGSLEDLFSEKPVGRGIPPAADLDLSEDDLAAALMPPEPERKKQKDTMALLDEGLRMNEESPLSVDALFAEEQPSRRRDDSELFTDIPLGGGRVALDDEPSLEELLGEEKPASAAKPARMPPLAMALGLAHLAGGYLFRQADRFLYLRENWGLYCYLVGAFVASMSLAVIAARLFHALQ